MLENLKNKAVLISREKEVEVQKKIVDSLNNVIKQQEIEILKLKEKLKQKN